MAEPASIPSIVFSVPVKVPDGTNPEYKEFTPSVENG